MKLGSGAVDRLLRSPIFMLSAAGTANQYTELRVILDAFEHGIKDGSIMSTDDTAIMRSLVEQIIVRETEIEIEFKCGVTIRQEYVR